MEFNRLETIETIPLSYAYWDLDFVWETLWMPQHTMLQLQLIHHSEPVRLIVSVVNLPDDKQQTTAFFQDWTKHSPEPVTYRE